MSVLINGMEMPTSCDDCFLPLQYCPYAMKPNGECPLTPIPPHGRLIDAEALPWENQGIMLTDPDEWGLKASDIENAPTIIPADLRCDPCQPTQTECGECEYAEEE